MKDDTVYIVSGFMRSGTSMMMKALEAGGMSAEYDLSRNTLNEKYGDTQYIPNGGGFYELAADVYRTDEFPDQFKGKLIKCLFGGMSLLKPGKYKVVFMLRDPEEIRQSYSAFFNKNMKDLPERYKNVVRMSEVLSVRNDVSLTKVWYRDVVNDPFSVFQTIRDDGWPIDAQSAAEIVDPELCRFRLEHLEIGIPL